MRSPKQSLLTACWIFIALILFVPTILHAATYYVSPDGDDSNPGTENSPWKTLNKVSTFGQSTEYGPGDKILLKRGQTWSERLYIYGTGTSGHNVTYGAYGDGTDPVIRSIYHRDYMHGNVNGNNEYITIKNMRITNGSSSNGVDVKTINHITFNDLYIYNCTTGINIDDEKTGMTDWKIQDVEVYNCVAFGVWSGCTVDNLIVTRLSVHDNAKDGAAFSYGNNVTVSDSVAYNNGEDGFDIGGTSGSLTYERCLAYDNASAGFSIKHHGTGYILYCSAYRNHEGLEVGATASSITLNSLFYNNSFVGVYLNNEYEHTIMNCIIFGNGESPSSSGFQVSYLVTGQTLIADYNCYGVQSQGRTFYISKDRVFKTFEEWRGYDERKYDGNSISENPNFVDPKNDNFALKSSSPCIDSGADLGEKCMMGLDPTSHWVKSIYTLAQSGNGEAWEIGPYVFQSLKAPAGLRISDN